MCVYAIRKAEMNLLIDVKLSSSTGGGDQLQLGRTKLLAFLRTEITGMNIISPQ